MAHDLLMYAIVQKDGLGLDRAVEEVKYRMSRYQVTPNMLIVPPQLMLYMATGPEEKIKYIDGGDLAVTRFEEGLEGYTTRAFRGLGVFTSMPYEVSEEADAVQMLQRNTQIGEFYRMSPPAAWDKKKLLPPTYLDIMIYDEERDQLKHITFEQALYATALGDVDVDAACGGNAGDGSGLLRMQTTLQKAWNIARAVEAYLLAKDINALQAAVLTVVDAANPKTTGATNQQATMALVQFLALPNTNNFVSKAIDCTNAGLWMPFCITIARPFIEHLMMSAVVTVSGRDTGATLFGPADMQVSANTSVKTIEGHYTCHTKSIITKPQNVYVMRDIMCNGYVAGGNTTFFGSDGGKTATKAFHASDVREDIQARLDAHDDVAGEYASMLAFFSPLSEMESQRDQVISLTDRLLPWEVSAHGSRLEGSAKNYFPGGQNGFTTYRDAFGLGDIHSGEDTRASENMSFISQGSINNGLCFIGPHRKYNPFSQNFYELVPGQGHFGPDAIPGVSYCDRANNPLQFLHLFMYAYTGPFPTNSPTPPRLRTHPAYPYDRTHAGDVVSRLVSKRLVTR